MSDQTISPWGEHAISTSKTLVFEIGPTRLHVFRRGGDLLVVEKRDEQARPVPAQPKLDEQAFWETGYRRYAFDEPVDQIHLRPRPPSRPVVVRPREPLSIAPGAQTTFYTAFPLDIQLSTKVNQVPVVLERTPSVVLSDTWFGDTTQGHLAYAIRSRARRDRVGYETVDHSRGVVSLKITNASDIPLRCEKVSLHLSHCALYAEAGHIWASTIMVRYRGLNELSALEYAAEAPQYLKASEMVAEAEESPPMGLIRRTFGRMNPALSGIL